MAIAKSGDTVKINYIGSLEDGTVFNESYKEKPLEFTMGKDLIAGFSNAIIGMEEGESKKVTVEPEEAYGLHNMDLIFTVDGRKLPETTNPELGTILQLAVGPGKVSNVAITSIEGATITVDGNHPLAGKRLTFDITLLEIVAE